MTGGIRLEIITELSDPRMEGKVRHKLSTIIFVALCGILCGCESWSDIRDYCKIKREWLSRYISLANGIPSSDTFRRVFTLLDPANIEYLLRTHAAEIVAQKNESDQIAVDGKALCGSKKLNLHCLYGVKRLVS